jgi:uncharacterized protein (DUF362 family)
MTVLLSNGHKRVKETLHHILDTFSGDIDVNRGIFIKPNIVFPVKPGSNEITSSALVKNLITALRERYTNIDIVIGEGVAAGCDPLENFRVSGYTDLAHALDIPLLDLHGVERKIFAWKFGKLALPSIALERTYINLPILKPSSACVISGALKNQKGLLLPTDKKRFHRLGLHEQIAELNRIIQPSLTILDCSLFFGPDVTISGNNCGEIDATACRFLDIAEPEHVKLSRTAGVFTSAYSILGDESIFKHASSRPVMNEYKHLARLRLWSNPLACTMCREIFRNIKHNPLNPQSLIVGSKLLRYSVLGAEIIMGSNPQWRKEYPTVICIGECTRRIANEGGFTHIPGCPPSLDELNKNLP